MYYRRSATAVPFCQEDAVILEAGELIFGC